LDLGDCGVAIQSAIRATRVRLGGEAVLAEVEIDGDNFAPTSQRSMNSESSDEPTDDEVPSPSLGGAVQLVTADLQKWPGGTCFVHIQKDDFPRRKPLLQDQGFYPSTLRDLIRLSELPFPFFPRAWSAVKSRWLGKGEASLVASVERLYINRNCGWTCGHFGMGWRTITTRSNRGIGTASETTSRRGWQPCIQTSKVFSPLKSCWMLWLVTGACSKLGPKGMNQENLYKSQRSRSTEERRVHCGSEAQVWCGFPTQSFARGRDKQKRNHRASQLRMFSTS